MSNNEWCLIELVQCNHKGSARVHTRPIIVPYIYADYLVEDLECDIHLYADDAVLMLDYQNSTTAFLPKLTEI